METDSRWSTSLQYLYLVVSQVYQAGFVGKTVVRCCKEDLLDQLAQEFGVQEWFSTSKVDLLHAHFCQEFDSAFGIFEREYVGCLGC